MSKRSSVGKMEVHLRAVGGSRVCRARRRWHTLTRELLACTVGLQKFSGRASFVRAIVQNTQRQLYTSSIKTQCVPAQ